MRRLCVILLTIIFVCSLISCSSRSESGNTSVPTSDNEKSFSISYDLGGTVSHFISKPSEAAPGETVELKTEVLFDADIHVYVDGQEIGKTHYDSDYWGYSFNMPDKDINVSAKFYTKDEIWGTETDDLAVLREKYPEYFDLGTFKGLELYVWQMAQGSYSCGLMLGTNRNKTLEELMHLKGASIPEMRAILSTYDIDEEDIFIIPWQNPISSYICEYWISLKDEDSASVEKRKQAYIDGIRHMLFDTYQDGEAGMSVFKGEVKASVVYANWTEDSRVYECLNAEKLVISSVRHLPVYKLDTSEDLVRFKENFRDILTLDQGYDEVASFNEVAASYDDSFFANHTVILAYVTASSGSFRYVLQDISTEGTTLCLNVVQMNHPEVYTDDMAGWFVVAEVLDSDLTDYTEFDAKLVN